MVGQDHAERLRVKLGFDGVFKVDSIGTKGGLALLWRTNGTASLLGYSRNHVDVEVTMRGFNRWRMTGFYGFAQRGRRNDAWELIKSLSHRSELPWVVIGDFNDLLYQYEKRGGNPHPKALLRGFGDTIDECGLAQLPMQGYPFTWERGEGTVDWIEEKLDKVLVTQEWRDVVREATVLNILTRRSDHSALFLGILNLRERTGGGRRGFRFEMAWLHDEGCRGVVETTWTEGRDRGLQARIELCGNKLLRWGGDRFHKFEEQIKCLRKEQLRLRGHTDQGDAMRTVILDYYRDIFSSNQAEMDGSFYANILPRVSHTQNDALLRPFEKAEVKTALFAMFPDKAPGPDGMNPRFYQHFWDVVGEDVSDFIVDCLNTRSLPASLNATDIVLIPKKKNPERVSDLRPIALSNVVYRVMAKMITTRMKPLMDEIISNTQSAFIPDRLITDNILIAAEVRHYLNRKQCGMVGWGALKLDMAKAYDRME
ncbi:PREDICTED: uncharacterized protein LOC109171734 [Ipomoea nil]|uniref:uncharacterized protein LOC109171734 n=1 Tax=Ipomoea nil TaxID=35883 RepID=UPI000901CFCB|nr:PREDICTED: uncharacterized protein LOC109171734 [Ipomoea nil]